MLRAPQCNNGFLAIGTREVRVCMYWRKGLSFETGSSGEPELVMSGTRLDAEYQETRLVLGSLEVLGETIPAQCPGLRAGDGGWGWGMNRLFYLGQALLDQELELSSRSPASSERFDRPRSAISLSCCRVSDAISLHFMRYLGCPKLHSMRVICHPPTAL